MWKEDIWSISLSFSLADKGQGVNTSMPPEKTSDYYELKTAILRRYRYYLQKFIENKLKKAGESVYTRLVKYVMIYEEYFVM